MTSLAAIVPARRRGDLGRSCGRRARPAGIAGRDAGGAVERAHEVRDVAEADLERDLGDRARVAGEQARGGDGAAALDGGGDRGCTCTRRRGGRAGTSRARARTPRRACGSPAGTISRPLPGDGKIAPDQLADRAVERAVGGALRRVDQEEAAEREVPAQRLDPGAARQLELALAGEVEERHLVERASGRRDDHRRELDVDRRALLDLPGEPAQRRRARVPRRACPELELADPELRAGPDRAGAPGHREARGRGRASREEPASHVGPRISGR